MVTLLGSCSTVLLLRRQLCALSNTCWLHHHMSNRQHQKYLPRKACLQTLHRTFAKKRRAYDIWMEYSSKVLREFSEQFDLNRSDADERFADLEDKLIKYEGPKNRIDLHIVNLMHINDQSKMMLDYLQYLRCKNGEEISPMLLRKAIPVITRYYPDKGLTMIREYMDKIPFNKTDGGLLVKNLLITEDWKYGVELFRKFSKWFSEKDIAQQCQLDRTTVHVLVAALKHDDIKCYREILREYPLIRMLDSIQDNLINYLRMGYISPHQLLEILKNFPLGLSFHAVRRFKEELKRYSGDVGKIEFVEFDESSDVCEVCGEEHIQPVITDFDIKQLDLLKEDITEDFLKNSKVPERKAAEELDSLWHFIDVHGPFDMVVDTLNITNGRMVDNIDRIAAQIKRNVKHQLGISNPRILFIAYKEMRRVFFQVTDRNCAVYRCMFGNRSDDWLVLLGALQSGPDTYIVTNDLYRDHLRWLNRQNFSIFVKWKLMRQIYFDPKQKESNMHFKVPGPYINQAYEYNSSWHIPFSRQQGLGNVTTVSFLQLPESYMCVRKL